MNDIPHPKRDRPDGPNLMVLAIVYGSLTVLALVLGAVLAGEHDTGLRIAALFRFGSAVPLAIFAATAYARQLRLGVRVPGPVIGFTGGLWAAGFLAFSACVLWAQSGAGAGDSLVGVLDRLAVITGGVGFATGAGLLMAGIAVPALILRFAPRWLCVTGLILAAAGEVSFLAMIAEPVSLLVPIVRFAGIAWLIAIAALLPRRRSAANAGRTS